MELTEELKKLLYCQGANLVGIGDISEVGNCNYKVGVAVAVSLPQKIIIDLQKAPTKEYYDLYYALNKKLNEIVLVGEEFLRNHGFEAYAQTTNRVKVGQNYISELPHKTVATRAGLGWIGKNCLLVNSQYGSAIRISSLLTNAPLKCDKPINRSRCGGCDLCIKNCPAQALKGTLWEVGIQREKMIDVEKCYKKQVEIMSEATGIETDLCGKCFAVCAYTQKSMRNQTYDALWEHRCKEENGKMKNLDPEVEKIIIERFGKDSVIALATMENGLPHVRYVNGYYEDGAFYVITHALSAKMQQIEKNPNVAIAGEWFTAHGTGSSLGYFGKAENAAMAEKLRKVFAEWIDNGHTDFSDTNTCILCITLTDGVLLSHGTRHDIDFRYS